jgi:predicted nucleotidyltransferase
MFVSFQDFLLEKVSPEDVQTFYTYHDELNPKLWDPEHNLDPKVANRLKIIADIFVKFLKIPKSSVTDVILTGSSVNYNWTSMSDIDLHVIVDMDSLTRDCPEYVAEYLQAKRKIWNDRHDIKIKGMEVELYPQDSKEVNVSSGFYSLNKNEWLKVPKYMKPQVDDFAVKHKVASLMNDIDETLSHGVADDADLMRNKLANMRKSGLSTPEGEFSVENLAFKTLRNNGYIQKLMDFSEEALDKKLSMD